MWFLISSHSPKCLYCNIVRKYCVEDDVDSVVGKKHLKRQHNISKHLVEGEPWQLPNFE